MKDPIQAWIDPGELRRLGELLMAPEPSVLSEQQKQGFYGESFEGYDRRERVSKENSEVAQVASENLAKAKVLAERSGLLASAARVASPSSEAAEEYVMTPATLFMGRMEAYRSWLQDEVKVKAFFLQDQEGEVFIDELQNPSLLQVSRTLNEASYRANGQLESGAVENLRVRISPTEILEVVPVSSHYGRLILGLLMTRELHPAAVGLVAQGLQQAIKPPGSP